MEDKIDKQKEYYKKTAEKYDEWHLNEEGGHHFALYIMSAIIRYYGVKSVLDVGSGTGRAVKHIKENHNEVDVTGIEPVEELRKQGYKKGIREEELIYGDARDLDFDDGEYDIVCEFSVLHHVKEPKKVIEEMLRVSRKGIFISDSNTFGKGDYIKRTIKQIADISGVWSLLYYIRTGGRGYHFSKGDGISYSYSVFDDIDIIRNNCKEVHMINTKNSGNNLYRSAGHMAIVGLK